MFKKLIAGAVAAFLLVGASEAMARIKSAWIVVDWESASGTVEVTADLCMAAVVEIEDQGFQLVTTVRERARVASLIFRKDGDAARLICLVNVFEEQLGRF